MVADHTSSTTVVVSVAEPELSAFFPEPLMRRLRDRCDPIILPPAALQDAARFAEVMAETEVIVTSWGFPALDSHRLALAPRLRRVVHTGASVKFLVTDAFWESGIPIVQAGDAMGPAVAELSLAFTLALLRRVPRLDHGLHAGDDWAAVRTAPRGREIRGARVGVIGASRTGRHYISSCLALGAEVSIHDPYVSAGDPLAALIAPLDEVLAGSDVVAIHAPLTDETRGMIGARELALIPDGGLLVNTARSALVDMDALFESVASGRIDVAIDVFDTEPLPADDRWRGLPNALITPHLGGATAESRERAGEIVLDEINRYLDGAPPARAIDRTRWEILG
jgi:phosphoglycerate dehydrogenase-like enzyme